MSNLPPPHAIPVLFELRVARGIPVIFPPMRTTQTIEYSDAKRIIDLIVEKATSMQKSAVVAVADSHGELIAFARMDGAPISSIRIAQNKAWTAARERKPTKDIGDKVRHPEKGHDIAYYGDPRFVGWGGGIPIWSQRGGSRRGSSQRPVFGRGYCSCDLGRRINPGPVGNDVVHALAGGICRWHRKLRSIGLC